jgi:uncharacterized protein DUF5343
MSKNKTASHGADTVVPPYISYRTFSGFMDRLRKGVPSRVDRSVMSSLSGSNQSQLMAALSYLQLISPKGAPTEKLAALVDPEGDKSQKAMRQILLASYPFLFKGFDLQKATFDELTGQLASAGASGDTVRKCVAFFLAAAKYAGLQISPFVTSRRRLRVRSNSRALPGDRKTDENERGGDFNGAHTWREIVLSKFPEFDPEWSPETKNKWFDAFDKLIKWMESADKS